MAEEEPDPARKQRGLDEARALIGRVLAIDPSSTGSARCQASTTAARMRYAEILYGFQRMFRGCGGTPDDERVKRWLRRDWGEPLSDWLK